MTKVSKPLTAGRIVEYHREQYTAPDQAAYYSEGGQIVGQFHGKLAEEFGLLDQPATEEIVTRLAEGQDPRTGEQLIKHRKPPEAPEWQKTNTAWAERLEERIAEAVQSGSNPFAAASAPGRPRNPEVIVEAARELEAPRYDAQQQLLLDIHKEATQFYAARLVASDGAAGREYLENRAVNGQSVEEFCLGFSGQDNELTNHLSARYTREQLLDSGLVYAREKEGELQDRFRNRIMIPIQDVAGNVVAFSGRRIDGNQDRKYINSPGTAIYKKADTLFNAHRAAGETDGRLVIVEGPLDAIQAHQAGVRKVAALSGTALNAEKIAPLSGKVLLNLDGDEPGKAAAEKHIERLLDAGLDVRVLSLADDADQYVRANGAEAYREAVQEVKPLIHWLGERAKEKLKSGDAYDLADRYRWMVEKLGHVRTEGRAQMDEEIRRHLGLREDETKPQYAEHRAGVDIVFSPPKSVSVQALVGGSWNGEVVPGDQRIVESHKRAVKVALDRMQEFVQARYRDSRMNTGNWAAATFLHDVARPVPGQAPNPQLHTHTVVFNMTRGEEDIRSMDPAWLYRTQSYGNAAYMTEMANDLRKMGYELERGKHFAFEIKGYSREYLNAMSLRGERSSRRKSGSVCGEPKQER